jgi:hypothetical protein
MRYLLITAALLSLCLPASAGDWTAKGAPKSFTPKTLYEYIDGAADLFLSYGFVGLEVTEYTRGSEDHLVTTEVYDLGEPINAFGIFASERPADVEPLRWSGPQGYHDVNLAFWQDRYYVKVLAADAQDAAAQVELAKPIWKRLPAFAGPPPELARLPSAHRLPDSERYLRQSALGHKFLERVVSATYHLSKDTAELHVADLRSPEAASKAFARLRDFEAKAGKYLAPLPDLGDAAFVVRDPSLGLMISARRGPYLVIAATKTASRPSLTDLAKLTLTGLGETKPSSDK